MDIREYMVNKIKQGSKKEKVASKSVAKLVHHKKPERSAPKDVKRNHENSEPEQDRVNTKDEESPNHQEAFKESEGRREVIDVTDSSED